MTRRPCELGIKGKGLRRSCGYCWPSGLFQSSLSVVALQTSSRKYSCSTRLFHDPFISSNVGPANNSEVRVSTLSRFIMNAEKSRGQTKSCSNHDRELEVSLVFETNHDAEWSHQQVDIQKILYRTPDVRVLPSCRV
ncbi:hypothetical protein Tco_0122111 [Tanacetum coccineum]